MRFDGPMVPLREAELDSLMGRLALGDRSAFDPLSIALRPRAVRLAELRLSRADAPDVAQAALLKVFSRASEFDPARPCLPWFYAIVANEIQATRRRRSAHVVAGASLGESSTSDPEDAETVLVRRELERALEQAVDALDGDSAHAINALLGRAPPPAVAAATFRKCVSRAYGKLRLLLGGHDAG